MLKFLVNEVPNPFWRHVTDEFFSPGGTSSGLCSLHLMGAFAQLRKAPPISFRRVCSSARPHVLTRIPLGWFSVSFYIETCMKSLWENTTLVKIGQKYRALYMTTSECFILFTATWSRKPVQSATTWRIPMKFESWVFFENRSKKFKFR
jgi:hypothetical protein